MKTLCLLILSVTAAIALADDKVVSVKMIVIADEIAIHTQADEGSETIYCYKKGDIVYTFGNRNMDTDRSDDGQYWLHVKTPKGDGWAQHRYLINEYYWEKFERLRKDGMIDAERLVKSLQDPKYGFDIEEISISPDKRFVVAALDNGSISPFFRIKEGRITLMDTHEWLDSLWSDDSRWLAGRLYTPDGNFDIPLSLYDTETQTTTYIDNCQNIENVEFFGGYLIWLGFEDQVDDELTWDLIINNFTDVRYVGEDYAGIYPVLWAYDLSTTRRCKLLDSFKLTIDYDENGHRQALMKPSVDCPAELKGSKLYKEYLGNKALIWYYKMN